MSHKPKGELVIQTIAMPQDTNPNGDIFGGWVTSQMDLGSGILGAKTAQARVVTAAMEGMSFLQPASGGYGQVLCARRENRADFNDHSRRSLGDALHDGRRTSRHTWRLYAGRGR